MHLMKLQGTKLFYQKYLRIYKWSLIHCCVHLLDMQKLTRDCTQNASQNDWLDLRERTVWNYLLGLSLKWTFCRSEGWLHREIEHTAVKYSFFPFSFLTSRTKWHFQILFSFLRGTHKILVWGWHILYFLIVWLETVINCPRTPYRS